jgi:class 3 adenylate cyclase
VKAAQDLQREFRLLGERWQTEYGLPAAVSLGIHLGETVFGMAGPQGAQQYVAFGDPVSVAERLVHRARNGEIVISAPVMKALGAAADSLGAVELPPIELSKRPAIAIYGVLLEDRLDFT